MCGCLPQYGGKGHIMSHLIIASSIALVAMMTMMVAK